MFFYPCTPQRFVLALVLTFPLLCAAQTAKPQFVQPKVEPTTGEVVSLSLADTQLHGLKDILYVEKPTSANTVSVGLLLNTGSGFANLPQNQHTFQNISKVVSAIADLDGDGTPDFIFATSPTAASGPELCVYFGTKAGATAGAYSTSDSGCTTFQLAGSKLPTFDSIAVASPTPGGHPQIYLTDSGNHALYVISNDGARGDGTSLTGFSVGATYPLSPDGNAQIAPGFLKANRTSRQDLVVQQGGLIVPYLNSGDGEQFTVMPALTGTPSASTLIPAAIRLADLDGDGNGDVIVLYRNIDSTASSQLYVWFGNGDGTFGQPQVVPLSHQFSVATIADTNGDEHPDIVLAGDGVVSVLLNQGGRTFQSDSGTACSGCAEEHLLGGQAINALAVADITGDGLPDIVVAGSAGQTSGPTLHANVVSPTGNVTILPHATTTTTGTISVNPEPSSVGGAFTITLTITPPSGSTAAPTGTVQFSIGGQNVGGLVAVTPTPNSPTSSSTAFVTVSSSSNTPPGSYPIAASYSGDTNYIAQTFTGQHTVGSTNTQTSLFLCVGPTASCPASGPVVPLPPYVPVLNMMFGQSINGAATVSKNDSNSLTGTTSFLDNGVVVCTYTTIGGQCQSNPLANLQTGQHNIVATYSGDPNHTSSTSPTVTINVAPDTTTTTLTGAPNPAVQGAPVTFTATVTAPYAAPVGTVTFMNGNTTIGTGTLTATGATTSTATITTSTLPVGTDQIVANFTGSQNFLPSGSGSFAETITSPGTPSFKLTVGPQSLKVGVGYTGALAVTITSVNGFSAPVNLSCGPLPREATCTFVAPVINGGGATTLFVGTTAPHDCNNSQPYFVGSNGNFGLRSLALPAMAGLVAIFLPGRRKWLRGLLMIVLAAGAMSVSGCGHCTDLATRPGTYTFTVNATSGGSSGQTQSQAITLTVYI